MKIDRHMPAVLVAYLRTGGITASLVCAIGIAEASPQNLAYVADLNPAEIEVMVNNTNGWSPVSIGGSVEQERTLSIQNWCSRHQGQGGYVKIVTDAEPVTMTCDSQPFFTFHKHDDLHLPNFLRDLLKSSSPPITRPTITGSLSTDEMYMISSIGPELDIIVDKATVSRESALQMASIRGPILRSGPGAKVFREAAPGVVLVLTNQGRGSGVVLSQQGEIITNWHVIDGAKWIGVFLKPPAGQPLSPSFYEARLVRIDQIADLALIQLRHAPSNLTALPLGDGRSIEVGSSVHAIGHPEGAYWTYTQGVISQVRADYRWTGDDKVQHVATVVQTQTPINPGNSGGPLLDDNANVIGVNSFRAPGNEGLNFAIGVDEIKRFLRTSASRVAENSTDVSLRPPEHVSTCEPRAFASFTDASIRKKVVPLDTQCRGYPNLYLIGERPGGSAEYALIDRIGDGKIDIRIIFGFGSGVDLWVVYGRRDGVPTAFGYDHGGKGKPDQFIAVAAGQQ